MEKEDKVRRRRRKEARCLSEVRKGDEMIRLMNEIR